jgi:hypothetical protein
MSDIPHNGWENVGKHMNHIFDTYDLSPSQFLVLYCIVKRSFGYKQYKTRPLPVQQIKEDTGISKPTVIKVLKELENKKMIKIIHANKFIDGGGKEAYSYAPTFIGSDYILIGEEEHKKKETKPEVGEGWK